MTETYYTVMFEILISIVPFIIVDNLKLYS